MGTFWEIKVGDRHFENASTGSQVGMWCNVIFCHLYIDTTGGNMALIYYIRGIFAIIIEVIKLRRISWCNLRFFGNYKGDET